MFALFFQRFFSYIFCLFIIVSALNARAAKITNPNSQGIFVS